MKGVVRFVLILWFAGVAPVLAADYRQTLGEEGVRQALEEELRRAPKVRLTPEAIGWIAEAAGRVEADDDAGLAAKEIRDGISRFLRAFATSRSKAEGEARTRDVEGFLISAPQCGMIPCSARCCRRCRSC